MMPADIPLCNRCKRMSEDKFHTCEAYPDGIPDAVYFGGHIFPKPGDNGLQFLPMNQQDYELFKKTKRKEEDAAYETFKHYKNGMLDFSDEK